MFSKGNSPDPFSYYSNLTKNSPAYEIILLGFVSICLILENRAFIRT